MTFQPLHNTQPTRRIAPPEKARYSLYKPELRDDFSKKCGYCDTLDYYSGGVKGFHIDHFAPKKKFVALCNSYENLIYCCPICNMGKSDDWPSDDANISYVGDIGYIDPCSPHYPSHLARTSDGKIVALTELGTYIHKRLKLSLKRRQLCWLIDKMESQLNQLNELIGDNCENIEQLKIFKRLATEYIKYTGILKRE